MRIKRVANFKSMKEDKEIDCWIFAKVIINHITFGLGDNEKVIREVIDRELDVFTQINPEVLEDSCITIEEWEEFSQKMKNNVNKRHQCPCCSDCRSGHLGLQNNHSIN